MHRACVCSALLNESSGRRARTVAEFGSSAASHRARSRPPGRDRGRSADHLDVVSPAQERRVGQQHVGVPTRPAPAPARAHPVFAFAPADRSVTGVAPRGELASTARAGEMSAEELSLDAFGIPDKHGCPPASAKKGPPGGPAKIGQEGSRASRCPGRVQHDLSPHPARGDRSDPHDVRVPVVSVAYRLADPDREGRSTSQGARVATAPHLPQVPRHRASERCRPR